MTVHFNRDHLTVTFQIDSDEDLLDAYQIEKLTKSPEWGAVLTSWAKVRELYLDAIKKVKPTENSKELRHMQSSALNGFDECISVVGKIIETAQKYRDERKREIEAEIFKKKEVDYGTADVGN